MMKVLSLLVLLTLADISFVQGQEDGDALLLDFYASRNDPCNLCGADDGVVGMGEVILPAGTAGILQEERTCAEVQELALDGYFRPASCLLMPYRLFELCGCISSQPPPVFPPPPRTTESATVFVVLEGLDSTLNEESAEVFEEVCAEFLTAQLGDDDVSDLTCTIENQMVIEGSPGDGDATATPPALQLELEITAGTPQSVDLGSLVLGALTDGFEMLIEALRDASDVFNGISGGAPSASAAPLPDPDGDEILGLDRNVFIAIAAGGGLFLFFLLLLCTCGRGTAAAAPPRVKRYRAEQPLS